MTRLGLRLALAGGRGSAVALLLAALAVGLGTAVLLFALSFLPALEDRAARDAWRDPQAAADPFGGTGLLWLPVGDQYDGRRLMHALVAPLEDAPVPPGIDRLPGAGETFVSPALERLLATVPRDELADRLGTIIGRVGDAALRSPDELVAITGADAATIMAAGGSAVVAFPASRGLRDLPPIAVLLVTLAAAGALAPVAVFVSTATRLSATRRELRLAALRLVGATTAQTVRFAVIEAVAVTTVGAALGVVLFVVLRPAVARIPLGATTWWPDAITPPVLPALVLLGAMPLVGAIAATVGLRRVAVSPLGIRSRVAPPTPNALRWLPLIAATAVFLVLATVFRGSAGSSPVILVAIGLTFAAIVGGIGAVGPWLTVVVARALGAVPSGAATLLAARRLGDDPRGSFGAIAGVIMGVFVATAFLTFAKVADSEAGLPIELEMRPGQVVASMPQAAPAPNELGRQLAAIGGVTAVLPVRAAQLAADDVPPRVWVVPCAEMQHILAIPALDCSAGIVLAPGVADGLAGTRLLVSDSLLPDGSGSAAIVPVKIGQRVPRAPEAWTNGRLPDIVVDPALLGDEAQTLPVTALYVATDGSTGAQERVRTAIEAAVPGAFVRTTAEQVTRDPTFGELGRVIVLGLFGTMLLAGVSLAVSVATSVADRRRQFALLRSTGMPASALARLVVLQGGAPLIAVAAFSAGWSILVTQGLLVALGGIGSGPDASVILVVASSVGVALAILLLVFPLLERLTRPETLRTE